jgi:hypothetical protein
MKETPCAQPCTRCSSGEFILPTFCTYGEMRALYIFFCRHVAPLAHLSKIHLPWTLNNWSTRQPINLQPNYTDLLCPLGQFPKKNLFCSSCKEFLIRLRTPPWSPVNRPWSFVNRPWSFSSTHQPLHSAVNSVKFRTPFNGIY